MLGTSTTLGRSVERDSTFAALLPIELSQRTGRKIRVHNESMMYQSPLDVILQFNEVLAAKPDLILWTLPPTSPLSANVAVPANEMRNPGPNEVKGGSVAARGVTQWFRSPRKESKEHSTKSCKCFCKPESSFYLSIFPMRARVGMWRVILRGPEADFLKTEPTPEWAGRNAKV